MPTAPAFIAYSDPRLSLAATARPVDAALRAIGESLLAAAEASRAYGLAAHHIGQVEPIAVISVATPELRDYRVLYNPRILSTSGATEQGPEGSVSMPGIEIDVPRPEHAEIAYDDADGQSQTISLTGFAARVAQHEIDQVNGIFFLTKVSRLKREAALRKYRKGQR